MSDEAKSYGAFGVTSYQVILGLCAYINSYLILVSFMSYTPGQGRKLVVLYVCGLFTMVILYRWFPLWTAVYGLLPWLYPLLGRWIAFPFFFQGISYGLRWASLIFLATAASGYVLHRIDLSDIARRAREGLFIGNKAIYIDREE
jgi:hypothetical protein